MPTPWGGKDGIGVWGGWVSGGPGTGALDTGGADAPGEAVPGGDAEPQAANTKARSTAGRDARATIVGRRPPNTVVNLATVLLYPTPNADNLVGEGVAPPGVDTL